MALKLCIKFIRRGAALVARGVREPFAHSFHFAGFTFSFFFLAYARCSQENLPQNAIFIAHQRQISPDAD